MFNSVDARSRVTAQVNVKHNLLMHIEIYILCTLLIIIVGISNPVTNYLWGREFWYKNTIGTATVLQFTQADASVV